jgi:hypothetical protein
VQQGFHPPFKEKTTSWLSVGGVCVCMWTRTFVASGLHLFATPST